MPAVTRMFNGTVLTFGTAVTKLGGLSYSIGGAWVDVSQPEDANKLFELGQKDLALRARLKGLCTIAPGTKNTLSIAWSDGTTTNAPGTWQAGPVENTGDHDAPLTSTIEFRPTVPDSA